MADLAHEYAEARRKGALVDLCGRAKWRLTISHWTGTTRHPFAAFYIDRHTPCVDKNQNGKSRLNMRQPIRTIAIDIDDTLNNFTEILHGTNFTHNETYPFPPALFNEYLAMLRKESADEATLRSREFSFLRQTINGECYIRAVARPDAVEFVQSLRADGWRIVICTHRDLRRAQAPTRQWLNDNDIPFDYLFIAVDKLAFCKDWGIEYLIDDHLYSIRFADEYGVNVFYPIMPKHEKSETRLAKGFRSFNEVRQWIPN